MPGCDRTGPMGMGPMTGGGRGRCNVATCGYNAPLGGGFRRGVVSGRGFGMGRGRGAVYGPRRMGPAYAPAAVDDQDYLKTEADYLRGRLDAITRRLEDVEG